MRGRPYFGDILPVHLAVFGRSGALMRFYVADGSAAVQLKGRSAVLCVYRDAEETGAFLRMQGVRYVNAGGAAARARVQSSVRAARSGAGESRRSAVPGRCPPDAGPRARAAEVTDFMMRGEDDPGAWDNFYSELCTKLARGAAEVWAVRREGALVSTAGAYALSPDTAYLAAVETLEALRGQGIGGWLMGLLAADLAARGRRVGTLLQKRTAEFLPPSWLCGGGYRAALCAGRAARRKNKGPAQPGGKTGRRAADTTMKEDRE